MLVRLSPLLLLDSFLHLLLHVSEGLGNLFSTLVFASFVKLSSLAIELFDFMTQFSLRLLRRLTLLAFRRFASLPSERQDLSGELLIG